MRRIRNRLTYANVMSTLAVVLALGGGVAYAANTVFSTDIVDGEVKAADIAQGAVATSEIANGQVKAADIGDGEVKTADIANGQVKNGDIGAGEVRSGNVLNDNLTGGDIAANSLKGSDVDEGTLDIGDAARAYARVIPDDQLLCTGGPFGDRCTFDHSKGVTEVFLLATGNYCVTVPGISASDVAAAVTVDWTSTANPEGNASAMSRDDCGEGSFRVITERQPEIPVDQGGGTSNATAAGPAVETDDVGFTIVIP